MTSHAIVCDGIRTPFGRYGGALSAARTHDLAAIPLAALVARNPSVDWDAVTAIILGCANQAGDDKIGFCQRVEDASGVLSVLIRPRRSRPGREN